MKRFIFSLLIALAGFSANGLLADQVTKEGLVTGIKTAFGVSATGDIAKKSLAIMDPNGVAELDNAGDSFIGMLGKFNNYGVAAELKKIPGLENSYEDGYKSGASGLPGAYSAWVGKLTLADKTVDTYKKVINYQAAIQPMFTFLGTVASEFSQGDTTAFLSELSNPLQPGKKIYALRTTRNSYNQYLPGLRQELAVFMQLVSLIAELTNKITLLRAQAKDEAASHHCTANQEWSDSQNVCVTPSGTPVCLVTQNWNTATKKCEIKTCGAGLTLNGLGQCVTACAGSNTVMSWTTNTCTCRAGYDPIRGSASCAKSGTDTSCTAVAGQTFDPSADNGAGACACPKGQKVYNGSCATPCALKTGQVRDESNNTCQCPTGQALQSGSCAACPGGKHPNTDRTSCVSTCSGGQSWNSNQNKCMASGSLNCTVDQEVQSGKCVAKTCSVAGQSLNSSGNCVCDASATLSGGKCACNVTNAFMDSTTGVCGCGTGAELGPDGTCVCTVTNQIMDPTTGNCACSSHSSISDGKCSCDATYKFSSDTAGLSYTGMQKNNCVISGAAVTGISIASVAVLAGVITAIVLAVKSRKNDKDPVDEDQIEKDLETELTDMSGQKDGEELSARDVGDAAEKVAENNGASARAAEGLGDVVAAGADADAGVAGAEGLVDAASTAGASADGLFASLDDSDLFNETENDIFKTEEEKNLAEAQKTAEYAEDAEDLLDDDGAMNDGVYDYYNSPAGNKSFANYKVDMVAKANGIDLADADSVAKFREWAAEESTDLAKDIDGIKTGSGRDVSQLVDQAVETDMSVTDLANIYSDAMTHSIAGEGADGALSTAQLDYYKSDAAKGADGTASFANYEVDMIAKANGIDLADANSVAKFREWASDQTDLATDITSLKANTGRSIKQLIDQAVTSDMKVSDLETAYNDALAKEVILNGDGLSADQLDYYDSVAGGKSFANYKVDVLAKNNGIDLTDADSVAKFRDWVGKQTDLASAKARLRNIKAGDAVATGRSKFELIEQADAEGITPKNLVDTYKAAIEADVITSGDSLSADQISYFKDHSSFDGYSDPSTPTDSNDGSVSDLIQSDFEGENASTASVSLAEGSAEATGIKNEVEAQAQGIDLANQDVYISKDGTYYKVHFDGDGNPEMITRGGSDRPQVSKGQAEPLVLDTGSDGSLATDLGARNMGTVVTSLTGDLSVPDALAIKQNLIDIGVDINNIKGKDVIVTKDGVNYKVTVDAEGNPISVENLETSIHKGDSIRLELSDSGKIIVPEDSLSILSDHARGRIQAFSESRTNITQQQILDQLQNSNSSLADNANAIQESLKAGDPVYMELNGRYTEITSDGEGGFKADPVESVPEGTDPYDGEGFDMGEMGEMGI